jgi:hypothetical protein
MSDDGRNVYGGGMGPADGEPAVGVADTEATQGDSQEGSRDTVGQKEGFVYFVDTCEGAYIKIGYSSDVLRRLEGFGVQMPGLRLMVLCAVLETQARSGLLW